MGRPVRPLRGLYLLVKWAPTGPVNGGNLPATRARRALFVGKIIAIRGPLWGLLVPPIRPLRGLLVAVIKPLRG